MSAGYLRSGRDYQDLAGVVVLQFRCMQHLARVEGRAAILPCRIQVRVETHAYEADLAPCCVRCLLHTAQPVRSTTPDQRGLCAVARG